MEIVTSFDDGILAEYESRGASSFFFIHIRIGGCDYPDSKWMDFGSVILGWWFSGVFELVGGENEIVLSFMDGPYSLRITRDASDNCLSCYNPNNQMVGTTSISELGKAICAAGSQVVEHLTTLGVDSVNVRGLKTQIAQLERILTL